MKGKLMFLFFTLILILNNSSLSGLNTFTIGGEVKFPKKGDIYIQLLTEEEFDNGEGKFGYIINIGEKELKQKKVAFEFKNVPSGIYGIRCFQDTNADGEFNKGLFGPLEPWGTYREARPLFRGPNFDEISFEVKGDITDIVFEIK